MRDGAYKDAVAWVPEHVGHARGAATGTGLVAPSSISTQPPVTRYAMMIGRTTSSRDSWPVQLAERISAAVNVNAVANVL